MRKLIVSVSVSFDGFMCGPHKELDWLFRSESDDSATWTVGFLKNAGAHLMGRKTFFDMASYWPTSEESYAAPMNDIPKIIFSRKGFSPFEIRENTRAVHDANKARTTPLASQSNIHSWQEAKVITGDLAKEIQTLKSQPGNFLLAHGGVSFIQDLIVTGLVDEYYIRIHPHVLGQGQSMWAKVKKPFDLKLLSETPFSNGMLGTHYAAT